MAKAKRNRHQEYVDCLAVGICPICQAKPITTKHKACEYCLEKKTQRRIANREKDKMTRKALYDKRKADGICVQCGANKAVENRVRCNSCLTKENRVCGAIQRERHNNDYQYAPMVGVCYYCHKPAVEGYKLCQEHYNNRMIKIDEYYAKKRQENTGVMFEEDREIRNDEIARLYNQHVSVDLISYKTNISRRYCYKIIYSRADCQEEVERRKEYAKNRNGYILADHKAGMSTGQLVEKYGMTRQSIRNVINFGVAYRK